MIEIITAPSDALFAIELWGDAAPRLALPSPCCSLTALGSRLLWLEPNTWLARAPKAQSVATLARLTETLGEDGAVTDISGAFTRLTIEGTGWRDLLMIGAVFDAESSSFESGCVAGTVIHHVDVRLDVLTQTAVDAYVAPSYAVWLLEHWNRSARRLAVGSVDSGSGR